MIGQKKNDLIEQKENLVFPNHRQISDKETSVASISYDLKAVIVQKGTKISSGHYFCYFKWEGRW